MGSRYGKKAYVNGLLIALNVLFFLYLEITDSSEDAYFMYTKGAMFAPAVLEDGEYYRLLTAMFMHFGIRAYYEQYAGPVCDRGQPGTGTGTCEVPDILPALRNWLELGVYDGAHS